MSIQRKIASFVILQASWITWLLAGFSTGGIAVVIDRVITLIRGRWKVRSLGARTRHHAQAASSPSLALSGSW